MNVALLSVVLLTVSPVTAFPVSTTLLISGREYSQVVIFANGFKLDHIQVALNQWKVQTTATKDKFSAVLCDKLLVCEWSVGVDNSGWYIAIFCLLMPFVSWIIYLSCLYYSWRDQ